MSRGWFERQRDSLRSALEQRGGEIVPRLREPDLEAIRTFLWLVDDWLQAANREASAEEGRASLIRNSVLQGGFAALLLYREGQAGPAADWIARVWADHRLAFGNPSGAVAEADRGGAALSAGGATGEQALEFLASYGLAASELLTTRLQDAQGRIMLRRLMTHLGLSFEDLSRVLQASSASVRRWERREEVIPVEQMSELVLADRALARLLRLFRPERLPQVVRRRAEIFHAEPALNWILRGRLDSVVERYEAALSFQP